MMRNNLDGDVTKSSRMNTQFIFECVLCFWQGCQIGHFMANFEKFGHFLTALSMKKRIWPFCKIWPFFGFFFYLSL